jgi:hypothetical protein
MYSKRHHGRGGAFGLCCKHPYAFTLYSSKLKEIGLNSLLLDL